MALYESETSLQSKENVINSSGQRKSNDGTPLTPTAEAGSELATPSISSEDKLPDNDHGNRFQSKLLFLFFIRAINNKNYKFHLGTELEKFGGKFDDLIFLKNYSQLNSRSFLYLQAKHRLYENPHKKAKNIKTVDLLNDNKGDLSLIKYFHSYCDILMNAKGGPQANDKVDCVICTNIGFDIEDLVLNGIELVTCDPEQLNDLPREMLTFDPIHRPVREDGKKTHGTKKIFRVQRDKFNEVANFLYQLHCVTNKNSASPKSFQSYTEIHDTLGLTEKILVLDSTEKGKMKFDQFFIDGVSISSESKQLRKAVDKLANEKTEAISWTKWKFPERFLFDGQKIPTFYRIKPIREIRMHDLCNVLVDWSKNQEKQLDHQRSKTFERYLPALIHEKVLAVSTTETNTMTFHPDFIGGTHLSVKATELRNILIKKSNSPDKWKAWKFAFKDLKPFFSPAAKNFRDLDTETEIIEDFFNNKLIFAFNMPNEEELNLLLNTEVGKNEQFNLVDTDLQSCYMVSQMNNWFKRENNLWLSAEEGEKLLIEKTVAKMNSLRATSLSLSYQEELNGILEFNQVAVQEMVAKLKPFIDRSNYTEALRIVYITTLSPTFTSVKVIDALRYSKPVLFQQHDSYLVTSLSRLQKYSGKGGNSESDLMRNALVNDENPQQLLIVVCDDDDAFFQVFESDNNDSIIVPENRMQRKRTVYLFSRGKNIEYLKKKTVVVIAKADIRKNSSKLSLDDTITYDQLTNHSKNALLSKTISFQMHLKDITVSAPSIHVNVNQLEQVETTVGALVGDYDNKVLDLQSMEELILSNRYNAVKIPSSFSWSWFERSLYIKRRLTFFPCQLDDQFWGEVAKALGDSDSETKGQEISPETLRSKCRIDSNGKIEWFVDDLEERSQIWKKIHFILERKKSFVQKRQQHGVSIDDTTGHRIPKIKEEDLIHRQKGGPVIISGVAGTGKSIILFQLYDTIKAKEPNRWLIRINLTDCQKSLLELKLNNNPEFDKANRSAVFDFLTKLPIVLVDKSPFSQSLLRHRLETGDRIDIMLDGFDEIYSKCQEATIQLIKCITADEVRQIGVYVTTRSHAAEDLQFQLSQLAYSLDNFSQQDQIDYLTVFWKANLNVRKHAENKERLVKEAAQLLVDRLSASLKDEERSFIGVPLQCRIVAECFLSPLQDLVQKQLVSSSVGGGLDDLPNMVDKQLENFSLINLYRLLMQKKHEIYRVEKGKVQEAHGHCIIGKALDDAIAKLKNDLNKLAVETIVMKEEDAKILIGEKQILFQSDAELEEEESKRGDDRVRFGLLDEIRDELGKRKVVFLHRTYAEYLMAEFFYKGLILNDKEHNKLLEKKLVRQMIINKILVDNKQYNGVQIFLNAMLGEMVDNEEWRKRINNRNLPDRLSQFSKDLYPELVRYNLQFFGHLKKKNALYLSVENRKGKIFKFLCDILDATFDRQNVQRAIKTSLVDCRIYLSAMFFEANQHGDASVEVFRRFLSYIDRPATPDANNQRNPVSLQSQRYTTIEVTKMLLFLDFEHGSLDSWNGKVQREIVRCLLQFVKENHETFNRIVNSYLTGWKISRFKPTLRLFIFNENYHDGHLKDYLEVLSQTDAYCKDDNAFAELITNEFLFDREIRIEERINKTLTVLRDDLGRPSVAIKVLRRVFEMEPEAYRRFYSQQKPSSYQQKKPMDDIIRFPENRKQMDNLIELLLERDEGQMTRLHQEAFYNQKENVKMILDTVVRIVDMEMGETVDKKSARKVIDLMAEEEDGFTPLCVAVTCGHEEICRIMLAFLKRVLNKNQLETHLTKETGFLHRALRNAIEDSNAAKLELILNSVEQELGRDCLMNLLKSKCGGLHSYRSIFASLCNSNKLFHSVVKILVSLDRIVDGNIANYQDLNTLIFHDNHTIHLLKSNILDVDTLNGMLSANGVGAWTRSFLTVNNIHTRFQQLLSREFLEKLTREQLSHLLDTITVKTNESENSYWENFDIDNCENDQIVKFFEFVSKHQDIDTHLWVKRLVLDGCPSGNDKEKPNIYHIFRLQAIANATLAAPFPINLLDEIKQNVKERAQQLIQDTFFLKKAPTAKSRNISLLCVKFTTTKSNSITNYRASAHDDSSESDSDFDDEQKRSYCSKITALPATRYLPNLLRFYLDFCNDEQLKEFVNVITASHRWKKGRKYSIWTRLFLKRRHKEMIAILKHLSKNEPTCGQRAIKKLLIHEVDEIPLVLIVALRGTDVKSKILGHLPKENREEMEEYFHQAVPEFVDKAFSNPELYFENSSYYKRLNAFTFLLNYSNEDQLKDFIKNITTLIKGPNAKSENLYYSVATHITQSRGEPRESETSREEDNEIMNRFKKCVSDKFGEGVVEEVMSKLMATAFNDKPRP